MRLAEFILSQTESILAEWEIFARNILPGANMGPLALRDHAKEILHATARDMMCAQTADQRSSKSKGSGETGAASQRLTTASEEHAIGRVDSGFHLMEVIAEYRALRASVLRLWRDSQPKPDVRDLDDVTRFNEAIDQSLTEAVSRYTQRVEQSRQMFLAILGHDLRNPLAAIMMSAAVLRLDATNAAAIAQLAQQIEDSGGAMSRMINDILDFTSTRLGANIPLTCESLDIESLCRRVLNEAQAAHPASRLHFSSDGPTEINGDAERLRQAITNLLSNAVQHGEKHGAVSLMLKGEKNFVAVSIHNQGRPISVEKQPTIFDPLVTGHLAESQHTRRRGSIGLGLYIARQIAVAHDGSIEVSSSEAQGTVFTLTLPRCMANKAAAATAIA